MNQAFFVPQHYHEDDRAQRLLDVFCLEKGQINVSYVNSTDHIVAWHKHDKQTDMWICLKGSFKVGLIADPLGDVEWVYLSDKNQRSLVIPAGVYHGYRALEPGSILLYYTTNKYVANNPDEIRQPVGAFDESWETPNK